jgi:hypothetical protein
MTSTLHRTKHSLSPARRRLVELMQEVNFGRIEGLQVQDGEPLLDRKPRVLREHVLGKLNGPNPARNRGDFALKEQILELFDLFDRERSVMIESLIVQNGLPVRLTIADMARVA